MMYFNVFLGDVKVIDNHPFNLYVSKSKKFKTKNVKSRNRIKKCTRSFLIGMSLIMIIMITLIIIVRTVIIILIINMLFRTA